jgi:hypothetical protein
MSYSHTTLAQFKTQLANRLDYGSKIYWTDTELGLLCNEALQLLGVAALYFRDRVTFPTVSGQAFYDIKTAQNGVAETPLQRSITDRQVVNSLQYSLQENVNDFSVSSVYAGTEMFTMDDLVQSVQRCLNQFLLETRCVVYETSQTVTTGDGRVDLSQTVLEIVRALWMRLDNNSAETAGMRLLRIDEIIARKQSPRWTLNSNTPKNYSIVSTPNLQLQLIPAPTDTAKLYLYQVQSNTDLDVSTGISVDLPNDVVQFVKWGALADLLGRDGQSRDPERSVYAEKRFQEGVELTKIYTSILNAEINGIPVQVGSVDSFDSQSPRWQKQSGKPNMIGMLGLNLVGLRKVPDDIYSVTADVVRNAVLPANSGAFIQVEKSALDVVLDYCEHVALFKCGGDEFKATLPHYQRFMAFCADYNSRLKAASEEFEILTGAPQEQEKDRPQRAA